MRRAWRALFAVVVAAALTVGATSRPGTAAPAGDGDEVVVEGAYRPIVLEGPDPREQPWLELDERLAGRELVRLASFEPPPGLRAGSRLRVAGVPDGGTFEVSSYEAPPDAPVASPGLAFAPAAIGPRSVLVTRVQWSTPGRGSRAEAEAVLEQRDGAWWSEVSYGAMTITADATEWITIATPAGCDLDAIRQQGQQGARAQGFDPDAYQHEVFVFPYSATCAFGGAAFVGGRDVWVNGDELYPRVTLHELGHNLGLGHAHVLPCTDPLGLPVPLTATCEYVYSPDRLDLEYGDYADTMGYAYSGTGHFSAPHKDALGWLGPRKASVGADADLVLAPLEAQDTRLKAVAIPGPGESYWLEYRQPIGRDAFLDQYPGATDGVLVHVVDSGGVSLLDLRPATAGDFSDAALPLGASWVAPNGTRVTVTGLVPGTSAQVSVDVPGGGPLNDDFEAAARIDGATGSVAGANRSASTQPGEPSHWPLSSASIWYRWTAPATGTARFDTAGSGFDTVLAVYAGSSLGALTQLAASDDFGPGPASAVALPVTAGTTYSVAVAGARGATGDSTLRWDLDETPTASAGPDQDDQPRVGGLVTLDGSGSSDPEGSPLTYLWTLVGGPAVTFDDRRAARPRVRLADVPASTTFTFEVAVTDPAGNVALDTVTVSTK